MVRSIFSWFNGGAMPFKTFPRIHPFLHILTLHIRSEYANTLVTELDLVCDYAQWPHISTSLFYVGSLLGNIIFGNIADRFTILGLIIKDMSDTGLG